jgi:hypothetical protein
MARLGGFAHVFAWLRKLRRYAQICVMDTQLTDLWRFLRLILVQGLFTQVVSGTVNGIAKLRWKNATLYRRGRYP